MFWTIHDYNYEISGVSLIIYLLGGLKKIIKGINSGLLLSSFILDYMIIRVKEKGISRRKIKRQREGERARKGRSEEESKGIGK